MSQITKKALEASLKELLNNKPLDKITINDIAENCGISRMTFYYHFHDIYELVEWCCIEDARKVIEEKRTFSNWKDGLYQLTQAMINDKTFLLNVYKSLGYKEVERYLNNFLHKLLYDIVNDETKNISIKEDDKVFIVNFYKYALTGCLLEWVDNKMKEEPERIVNNIALIMDGSVIRSIDIFRNDKY